MYLDVYKWAVEKSKLVSEQEKMKKENA